MKTCYSCKRELPLDKFNKSSRSKDGLRGDCKDCKKAYYHATIDRVRERGKEYYEKNKEEILRKQQEYLNSLPEEVLKERTSRNGKNYYSKNQEKLKEKREKNKEWKQEYDKTYNTSPALFNSRRKKPKEYRQSPINPDWLEVQCKYCDEWFTPTNLQIKNHHWNNLYCSDNCRDNGVIINSSEAEKEIQEFVSQFNHEQINNDRSTILNPYSGHFLELDVFLPKLKKAIEFNGMFWHTLENVKNHDRIKKETCEKLGIDLLIIKEQAWLKDKDSVKEKIKNFLIG